MNGRGSSAAAPPKNRPGPSPTTVSENRPRFGAAHPSETNLVPTPPASSENRLRAGSARPSPSEDRPGSGHPAATEPTYIRRRPAPSEDRPGSNAAPPRQRTDLEPALPGLTGQRTDLDPALPPRRRTDLIRPYPALSQDRPGSGPTGPGTEQSQIRRRPPRQKDGIRRGSRVISRERSTGARWSRAAAADSSDDIRTPLRLRPEPGPVGSASQSQDRIRRARPVCREIGVSP
jgi:hypothetical protein